MQLNLETDYAIRCLLYLASQSTNASSAQIGEAIALSSEHAQKILRRLRNAGFVKAAMGSAGGYYLAAAPAEICVYDVICKLEGEFALTRCLGKDPYCSNYAEAECSIRLFLCSVQSAMEAIFKHATLQDVIDRKFDGSPIPLSGLAAKGEPEA